MTSVSKPVVSGVVAAVVSTVVASAVGGRRQGLSVGLITGSAVALTVWVGERRRSTTGAPRRRN
jgi:hypothetical protein